MAGAELAARRAWSIPPTTAAADETSSYTQLNAIKLKGRKQKPARDQSAALPPPPHSAMCDGGDATRRDAAAAA